MALTEQQLAEIEEQRSRSAVTRRATVPALEELLFTPVPLLDHGFVRVIDYMGDDAAIVQAARVSYGRGTKKVSEDAGLIRYLIRHRTANVNEYSARYSILDREFYIPEAEQLAAQSRANHQGRGDVLEGVEAAHVLDLLREDATRNYDHYAEMLNEDGAGAVVDPARQGLARELARMNLSLNFYTQWYWKTDLHNLLHFLSLRADAHAQYEIRVYADAMIKMLKAWVPATYQAFLDYRLGAVNLSAQMLAVVRRMIGGEVVEQAGSGLSKREWGELMGVLGRG